MNLKMRMDMELLTEQQLEEIFQRALTIWREIGFHIQGTDEFFSYLSDYGCTIDGEMVYFPESVIDRTLDRIRDERRASESESDEEESWPESELGMFTHGQALHICDIETNELREATTSDLAAWSRAVDALGDVTRTHPTFIPQDAPRGARDFHAYATIILNSRRPHAVSVYSAAMLPFFIRAATIAQGSLEAVKNDPTFYPKCWVTSPFRITRENIEIAMDARRELDIPITFGHMPVAGASTPVTLAGALAQDTAESLALCAMRLAIDGLPAGITSSTTMIDMKDGSHRQSGPDLALHVFAGARMQAYLFGGEPTPAGGYTGVAAATVSPQSLYEKALSATFAIATGARKLGIGCLAYSDVGSPVQLLLDYEMGRYFRRLFGDITVDADHIGLETILATVPRGAFFLDTNHTAEFFRQECWLPKFIDHRPALTQAQDSQEGMIEAARNHARQLFHDADNQCGLSAAERGEIRQLMAEASAAAGAHKKGG